MSVGHKWIAVVVVVLWLAYSAAVAEPPTTKANWRDTLQWYGLIVALGLAICTWIGVG